MDVLRKKDRLTRKDKRAFLLSFTITLSICIILIGALKVDYEGRKLSFADDTPVFSVSERAEGQSVLSFYAFGSTKEFEVTKIREIYEKILEFCCIPYK